MARLKVFRTPIGFHDAYVAAPSQAAALKAWGATANLFARGVAEVVTDSKLTKAPLAAPGEVVRVARGTEADHLAALPRGQATVGDTGKAPARSRAVKSKPRPSRAKLDAAEKALAKLEAGHRAAQRGLAEREAALRRERRTLAAGQAKARGKLEAVRNRAAKAYGAALEKWRG